eukprot:TRINITY_DN102929_c0_g1_i1.p1 TRINITY_DN102929_c0_g1~~TRINITY_DN102929_c0_g1_i1.p1  ORF type:complete len:423 (-),score=247.13 TRINITY_DN102929_c0_g1_i1:56-1297(-)
MSADRLSQLFRADLNTKVADYNAYIDELYKAKKTEELAALVKHVVAKEGAEAVGRAHVTPNVLDHFIAKCSAFTDDEKEEDKFFDVDEQQAVALAAYDALRVKHEDFPSQFMKTTRWLSECYQGQGDFKRAAQTLSSFRFDAYIRTPLNADPQFQMQWWIDATMFYLEINESGPASQCIKRGHSLASTPEVRANREMTASFLSCYARVLDAERKFLLASRQYLELSQMYGVVDESDLLGSLGFAVICAILAKAGPSRARVLGMLYSDERTAQLPSYSMLEKMYKDRIIRQEEVEKFKKLLQVHQNATVSGGDTVLSRSIKQHNVLACSKIYNNIAIQELGQLLGTTAAKAEALVRKMVEEGRLQAAIDQAEGLVEFETSQDQLNHWDKQILSTCMVVGDVVEGIAATNPEYSY